VLKNYQILFINPDNGTVIDLIDARRIQGLQYSRKLNDFGRMQLTVLANDRISTLNGLVSTILQDQVNVIMDIYRDNGAGFVSEDSYLLRYVSQFQGDGEIDYLVLGGDQVARFLQDTIIIPQDDPLGANGYSTKDGVADTVMYELVDNQLINPFTNTDRTRPYISNNINNLQGQQVFGRYQYQTVLEILKQLVVQGNIDFTLTRTTGANFLFTVQIVGRVLDYTSNYPFAPYLLFSPERRNLKNPNLTINRYDEITVTWIASQGIEEDRTVTDQVSPELYRPLNRRENLIDARQIEDGVDYLTGITTAGAAELRAKQPLKTFDFEIDTNVAGARYQTDWQLGDRVTAKYLDYQEDLRIVQVDVDIKASSENVKPTFQRLIS